MLGALRKQANSSRSAFHQCEMGLDWTISKAFGKLRSYGVALPLKLRAMEARGTGAQSTRPKPTCRLPPAKSSGRHQSRLPAPLGYPSPVLMAVSCRHPPKNVLHWTIYWAGAPTSHMFWTQRVPSTPALTEMSDCPINGVRSRPPGAAKLNSSPGCYKGRDPGHPLPSRFRMK